MAWYHIMIGLVAAICAVASYQDRRALLVIGLCVASYVVSVLYVRLDLVYPVVFAGGCDALCAAIIYCVAKYRWELLAEKLFLSMLLINIIYGFSLISTSPNPILYQAALEIVTLMILIFAGGQKVLRNVGDNGVAFGWIGRNLCGLAHTLHKKRTDDPWIYS